MSKISCQSRENSLPARTKDERVFDTLYHRPLSGKTEDPCEQSKVCNQQFDTHYHFTRLNPKKRALSNFAFQHC